MDKPITPEEARAALRTVDRERLRVIDQVNLPAWYWWGLALGWVALGAITDLNHPWLTAAATLVFGAVHSAVAPRVVDGRHGSDRLRVGRDVVGHQVSRLVLAGLVGLAGLTIAASVAAGADGARHPVTTASVLVAVILVLGGPRLLEYARRRLASRPAR
jgi:MFS superfamily sulfate permease-like transporter